MLAIVRRRVYCVLVVLAVGGSMASGAPMLIGLGDLTGGSFASDGDNVAPNGTAAVGNSDSPAGAEAFLWTPAGGMIGLGFLPGRGESDAYAVSDGGAVVVGIGTSSGGGAAFRWTAAGGMTDLGPLPPGGGGSVATGISADGAVIVGTYITATGREAFRWTTGGGFMTLGDLSSGIFFPDSWAMGISPDGTSIVGRSLNDSGFLEAFRWRSVGGMIGLADLAGGAFSSVARAASADGSVVVGRGTSASGTEAFRWEAGSMTGLGDLAGGAFSSEALGVSGDGSIVVGLSRGAADGTNRAFLWTAADGMQDLRDILLGAGTTGLEGWTLYAATGISTDGRTIVGFGINPIGRPEGWIVTIPEPSSLALLTAAALVLVRSRVWVRSTACVKTFSKAS